MEDERRKKRFEDHRIKFKDNVNPVDLLPYLDCLTKSLKEQVERWQDREGPQRAAFRLSMELVKKDNWYPDLIRALRINNHNELADGIENRPRGRGPGPRPHDGGHDGGPGGGPGPGPGPGPDDGTDDNGNDGRHRGGNGAVANPGTVYNSNSSPSSNSTGPVSGQSQPTSQLSSRKTKPIKAISVNTPLKKLPCHYQTVVDKLNTDINLNSLCILAGQLGITSEEFNRIQHTSNPATNPTREVLNLWIQSLQTEEVTLQDLLVELYAIKRFDIITELLKVLKISDWNPPGEQDSSTPQHAEEAESCDNNSSGHATQPIANDKNRESQLANALSNNKPHLPKHGHDAIDISQQSITSGEEAKIQVRNTEPEVSACSLSADQKEHQSSVANSNGALNVKAQHENEKVERREHKTVGSAAVSSSEQEQPPKVVSSANSSGVNEVATSDSGELELEEESIASDNKKEVSNVAINVNTPREEKVYKLRNLGENIVESVTDNTGPTIVGNTVNDESQFMKNEGSDSSTESKSDIDSNDTEVKTSVVNMEDGPSSLRSDQTIEDNSDKVASLKANSDALGEPGKSICTSSFFNSRGDGGEENRKLSESSPGLAESSPVSNSTTGANSSEAETLGQGSNRAPDAGSDKSGCKVDSLEEMMAIASKNSESVNLEKQKGIESKRVTVDMASNNDAATQQKPISGSQDLPGDLPSNQPPQNDLGDGNTDTNSADKSPAVHDQEHAEIVGPDSSEESAQGNESRWPQLGYIVRSLTHQMWESSMGNTPGWMPN